MHRLPELLVERGGCSRVGVVPWARVARAVVRDRLSGSLQFLVNWTHIPGVSTGARRCVTCVVASVCGFQTMFEMVVAVGPLGMLLQQVVPARMVRVPRWWADDLVVADPLVGVT